MDILLSAEHTIPVLQVVWLISMNSVFLLLRRIKLALITNYVFSLYWGYTLTQNYMFNPAGDIELRPLFYFGAAAAVLVVALVGFLLQEEW